MYDGMTIKYYLRHVHHFSRRLMKAMTKELGAFKINDVERFAYDVLHTGDMLSVQFPNETRSEHICSQDIPLNIIYEDDAVLVLDKPAGMAVMPSMNQPNGTLANALAGYYEQNRLSYTVHIVTRLDKDTSGLVLVAKHRYAHMVLSEAQKNTSIKRSYVAIIQGTLPVQEGVFTAPIGRKQDSVVERVVRPDGQKAVTHFQVREAYADHTVVDVRLETGRTHQIRVHFSHAGYPLAGDTLYGGRQRMIMRQALHSTFLEFEHPITKAWHSFHSPIPPDMQQVCQASSFASVNS
nr:RluA family pseudouridine synthase [Lentibacillus saliphilus]